MSEHRTDSVALMGLYGYKAPTEKWAVVIVTQDYAPLGNCRAGSSILHADKRIAGRLPEAPTKFLAWTKIASYLCSEVLLHIKKLASRW